MWPFRRTYSVSVLDSSWEVIKNRIRLKVIPTVGEVMYFEKDKAYYKVVTVVHNIKNKHNIWLVVEHIQHNEVNLKGS